MPPPRRLRPIRTHETTAGGAEQHAPQVPQDAPQRFVVQLIAELPRLRRYALAWLGNAADADDLVQECIQRAVEHRGDLREPERMRSWLFSILHNLHLSGLRRRERQGALAGPYRLNQELLQSVPAPDVPLMRDFLRAVNQLSEEHREILLLVALEGMSYREAADVLGVPIGTVMSRLARARERLRALLEGAPTREVRSVR